MSQFQAVPTDLRRQYESIRRDFGTVEVELNQDGSLDGSTRASKIDQARRSANQRIDALRRQVPMGDDGEQDRLVAKLFRPQVGVAVTAERRVALDASYRDALDRATQAEGGQLAALYRRAETVGDDLLARATLVVAFGRPFGGGGGPVIRAYCEDHADEADDIARLDALRNGTGVAPALLVSMQIAAVLPHV